MILAATMIVLAGWVGMLCLMYSSRPRIVKTFCAASITFSMLALLSMLECIRNELLCAAVCAMIIMIMPLVKARIRHAYCYTVSFWMSISLLTIVMVLAICKVAI